MLALARRRDRRVFPVVERRLGEDEVGRLEVEAAAYLADERLLVPLRTLESWWDLDLGLLTEAVAACDPAQQARSLDEQTTFLMRLEGRLAEFPAVRAWLSCERLGREVSLAVDGGAEVGCYDFEALLTTRAGGDVEAAVEAVLSDLRRTWPP